MFKNKLSNSKNHTNLGQEIVHSSVALVASLVLCDLSELDSVAQIEMYVGMHLLMSNQDLIM